MGAPPVVSFLLKRVWCEFFVEACRSIPSSQGHCDSSPSHENYASSRTPVPVTSQTSLGPIVSLEFFCPQILTGCATAWPDWMCDCLCKLSTLLPCFSYPGSRGSFVYLQEVIDPARLRDHICLVWRHMSCLTCLSCMFISVCCLFV